MKKSLSWIMAVIMVLSICCTSVLAAASGYDSTETESAQEISFRACEHTYSYELQSDSYESTDTSGGYRHYICSECGEEYSYYTDPLVYEDGFVKQDGIVVEVNEGNIGATNPYLPQEIHSCDGEPHVYWSKDDLEWRVYVYCSLDTKETGYCSGNFVIYSAPVYNLADWRFEDTVVAQIGIAGDCAYNLYNDLYYFSKMREIWCSDSPGTGFDEDQGGKLIFTSNTESNPDSLLLFDPALYIDENGTMYMFSSQWGSPNLYHVSTMSEDYSKIENYYTMKVEAGTGTGIDQDMMNYPYEGPSIRYLEDEDIYVMVYASDYGDEDSHWESVLSYAWTDDIENEVWNYGGIVYDTGGHFTKNADGEVVQSDTATFNYDNNHGGMEKINGQWYIFGHRNTYIAYGSRQGLAEKIDVVYEDGELIIDKVEMTSSGLADYLDAYETYEAAIACYMTPAGYTGSSKTNDPQMYVDKTPWDADENAEHAFPIAGIQDESVIGYKYLNFGDKSTNISLNLLVAQEEDYVNGKLDVWIDAPTSDEGGTLIGSIDSLSDAILRATEQETGTDGTIWSWISSEMDKSVSGVHAVYFVLEGADEDSVICKLDEFSFSLTEDPEPVLNTSLLKYIINYADDIVEQNVLNGVIQIVVDKFNAALDNAKAVLANPTSQSEIDEATLQLLDAIQYLEFKQADKSELESLVELVSRYLDRANEYTPVTYQPFMDAYNYAQSIMNDQDLMDQDEVTEAWQGLADAVAKLRLIPDKSKLVSLLSEAKAIDLSLYTSESVTTLNSAMDIAENVINNENSEEEEVKSAELGLTNAMDAKVLSTQNTDQDTQTSSDNTGNTNSTENESTAKESSQSSSNGSSNANNPKTGDYSILFVSILLLGSSLLLLSIIRKNRVNK